MDKPITLVRHELQDALINAINSAGLPAFVIRGVLEDLLGVVRQQEEAQLRSDMELYNASDAPSEE